jgi:hypothetical protein
MARPALLRDDIATSHAASWREYVHAQQDKASNGRGLVCPYLGANQVSQAQRSPGAQARKHEAVHFGQALPISEAQSLLRTGGVLSDASWPRTYRLPAALEAVAWVCRRVKTERWPFPAAAVLPTFHRRKRCIEQ